MWVRSAAGFLMDSLTWSSNIANIILQLEKEKHKVMVPITTAKFQMAHWANYL